MLKKTIQKNCISINEKRKRVIDFYENGDHQSVLNRINDWYDMMYNILLIVKEWDDVCITDEYNELKFLKYVK